MAKREWDELGAGEKAAIIAVGAVQISLCAAALADIYHRPEAEIRGKKPVWVVVSFVNVVGPVSYFLFGRKRRS